jgi:hypothetical protein
LRKSKVSSSSLLLLFLSEILQSPLWVSFNSSWNDGIELSSSWIFDYGNEVLSSLLLDGVDNSSTSEFCIISVTCLIYIFSIVWKNLNLCQKVSRTSCSNKWYWRRNKKTRTVGVSIFINIVWMKDSCNLNPVDWKDEWIVWSIGKLYAINCNIYYPLC